MRKILYIDIIIVTCIFVLYITNNKIIKKTEITFFLNYFNDCMCPIFLLAFTNIIMWFNGKYISRLWQMLLLIGLCGIFWEFYSLNKNSVADPMDMICYLVGAMGYWGLKKIFTYDFQIK